ncbi:MAG TPA: hypothetical protein VI139_07825 [Gemmatimonadales bacterium]
MYKLGWFVQLALTVVACPMAGEAGFALGVHTGTPPPTLVTHVTVWFGGVPDTVKLAQAGLVYVNVAASGFGDKAIAVPIAASVQHRPNGRAEERSCLASVAICAIPCASGCGCRASPLAFQPRAPAAGCPLLRGASPYDASIAQRRLRHACIRQYRRRRKCLSGKKPTGRSETATHRRL